ncbi:MAG: hypothetical protein WBN31_10990 [Gammaproteobacteria bacterium]
MTRNRIWIAVAAVVALAGLSYVWFFSSADPAATPQRQGTAGPENPGPGGLVDHPVFPATATADAVGRGDAGIPEFDINALTNYQDLLDQIGVQRDWTQWARERGLVVLLEADMWPVYVAMDDAELRSLAEAGDLLAEFAITQKLMIEQPLEAYDRIRLLVLEGSVEAMDMMQHQIKVMQQGLEMPGASYGWSDQLVAEVNQFIEQSDLDLRTERMAWLLLTEVYMGQPRGSTLAQDPDLGIAPGVLPIEYRAACARAQQLRDSLLETWVENGLEEPPIEAPPIGFVGLSQNPDLLAACPASELPLADLSGCRTILMRYEGTVWDDYVCATP